MSGRGSIKEREIRRPSSDILGRVGLIYEWWFMLQTNFVDVVHGTTSSASAWRHWPKGSSTTCS